MTPTTAAVMPASAPRQRLVVAQPLDEGRAEPDPQKARHEGPPGREQPAQRAGEQRRQRAGIAVGGHEADELHDHDQRARRRLGHAEPVEHLAGPEPAIGLDRLLRHVGEHRIGAAEGDDRHLREEQADLAEGVAGAERRDDRDDRAPATARARPPRPATRARSSAARARAVPRRAGSRSVASAAAGRTVPPADDERRRAGARADKADDARPRARSAETAHG